MDERDVQRFWKAHPCGDDQAGGLTNTGAADYEQFFQRYDAFRYRQHAHLLTCLDAVRFEGQEVLEIGLGQGAGSEQIIRSGARWSGLDLTYESVARVRARLTLRNLPYQALKQGSALDIPFPDSHFDLVFSHGVLHHIPEIRQAQSEIARVLKPGGTLIAMLYAKWSLNYLLSIAVIRRLGLCVVPVSAPGAFTGNTVAMWRRWVFENTSDLRRLLITKRMSLSTLTRLCTTLREYRTTFQPSLAIRHINVSCMPLYRSGGCPQERIGLAPSGAT
ncbi:MAG: class I SAM-dependent methyltransferase [Acidobacteriaceae bacterium]